MYMYIYIIIFTKSFPIGVVFTPSLLSFFIPFDCDMVSSLMEKDIFVFVEDMLYLFRKNGKK